MLLSSYQQAGRGLASATGEAGLAPTGSKLLLASLSKAFLFAGLLETTRAVMSANLPRVFEDVGSGAVKPVEVPLHLSKIGGDFNNEELVSISRETVRY